MGYRNPSDGNRGFVSGYAGYLASQNGGVAPNVVNLAIDGETIRSRADVIAAMEQRADELGLGPREAA